MIRFPGKHIADDVAERILAVEKRLNANSVSAQGQRLEQALSAPIGDVAPIEGIEDLVTLKALDV
jgi:hypothetical protein